MKTKTIDTVESDIDYESFVEMSDKGKPKTGLAILKNVECVKGSNLPDAYKESRRYRVEKDEEYYLFTGESQGIENDIQICVRSDMSLRVWDVIECWTESRDVSSLAGSRVPINRINNEYYIVEEFEDYYNNLEPSDAKYCFDIGAIEYDDGSWNQNKVSRKYDEFTSSISTISSVSVGLLYFISMFVFPNMFLYFSPVVILVCIISMSISGTDKIYPTIMKFCN